MYSYSYLILFACIALVVADEPSTSVEKRGAGDCYQVTSSSGLSMRTCASTGCGIIKILPNGAQVSHTGQAAQGSGYTWFQISDGSNTGWSAVNWLTRITCPSQSSSSSSSSGSSSSGGGGTDWGVWPGGSVWQLYGRTTFARDNCAAWYTWAGCMHNGIDLGMPWGSTVRAVCSGDITASTDHGGGNPMSTGPKSVVQRCGNYLVLYGHMSSTEAGYKNAGDSVGRSGNPGGCSTCGNDHLHLEIRKFQGSNTYSSNAVNPRPLFSSSIQNRLVGGYAFACGDMNNQPEIWYGTTTQCQHWTGCPTRPSQC
jgi:hypothetical protein